MSNNQLERGLKLYSFFMGIALLSFTVYDYIPGERLGEGKKILNPNSIAMVAFSASLASMAFRNILIRYMLFSILFLIIYLAGSRASAAGTLLGLGAITFIRIKGSSVSSKLFFIVFIMFALFIGIYYRNIITPIIDDFLDLNTSDRGIASGASGRIYAWMDTIRLFEENPVFGVGFRAHEHLLAIGTSSHNGYLAILAEIGLFGFLSVMYLVLSGEFLLWRKAYKQEDKYTHSILFGLSLGYLFLAIFERFLINVGNPTSLLFLLGILSPVFYEKKSSTKMTRSLDRKTKARFTSYQK